MAFDKDEWFQTVWNSHSSKPSTALLERIADELAALHAETDRLNGALAMQHADITALKARLPEPEPARETGWAVVTGDDGVILYFGTSGFSREPLYLLWFRDAREAEALADAAGDGRPALLYKDTLEEVR